MLKLIQSNIRIGEKELISVSKPYSLIHLVKILNVAVFWYTVSATYDQVAVEDSSEKELWGLRG